MNRHRAVSDFTLDMSVSRVISVDGARRRPSTNSWNFYRSLRCDTRREISFYVGCRYPTAERDWTGVIFHSDTVGERVGTPRRRGTRHVVRKRNERDLLGCNGGELDFAFR